MRNAHLDCCCCQITLNPTQPASLVWLRVCAGEDAELVAPALPSDIPRTDNKNKKIFAQNVQRRRQNLLIVAYYIIISQCYYGSYYP